jgi:hypothetical protein
MEQKSTAAKLRSTSREMESHTENPTAGCRIIAYVVEMRLVGESQARFTK